MIGDPDHRGLVAALVLASGSGTRARRSGAEAPKQFQKLGGRPLLAWSLEVLARHPRVEVIGLVVPPGTVVDETWNAACSGARLVMVEGGASRQESAFNGLRALAGANAPRFVLIHDGARPFVTLALVDRLLAALGEGARAAAPALPVTDTLKSISPEGLLVTGPDRSALRAVQTPQAFEYDAILEAHETAAQPNAPPNGGFTDDTSVMAWAGHAVVAVDGDHDNIKVTDAADWARAERIAATLADGNEAPDRPMIETRTGLGYDVHRLVPGDGVWLCGVHIAHTHRLDGHSDADVGLHALTDALLGALGDGDIGTHFPPSDPQWKGAASSRFAAHAAELVRARGGRIVHVDVALVAENPKIGPHRPAMIEAMAAALQVEPSRVSVKATTNERMGFAGREEGIAAFATASVELPRLSPETEGRAR